MALWSRVAGEPLPRARGEIAFRERISGEKVLNAGRLVDDLAPEKTPQEDPAAYRSAWEIR